MSLAIPSVLLDLDGTLIDSQPGILASCKAALRALGHEPAPLCEPRCDEQYASDGSRAEPRPCHTRMVEKHYGYPAASYVTETVRKHAPRFGITDRGKVRVLRPRKQEV